MITDQRLAAGGMPTLGLLIEKADHLVQTIASPSIVQLVLRLALAVPFWRSGILKWGGFLRLNDTAVTLFTDEFMLHLPGGPYHYPAPTVMAYLSAGTEFFGGLLLIVGFLTRFAALATTINMLVAIFKVHFKNGFTAQGNYQFPLALGVIAFALIFFGAGPISIDWAFGKKGR